MGAAVVRQGSKPARRGARHSVLTAIIAAFVGTFVAADWSAPKAHAVIAASPAKRSVEPVAWIRARTLSTALLAGMPAGQAVLALLESVRKPPRVLGGVQERVELRERAAQSRQAAQQRQAAQSPARAAVAATSAIPDQPPLLGQARVPPLHQAVRQALGLLEDPILITRISPSVQNRRTLSSIQTKLVLLRRRAL